VEKEAMMEQEWVRESGSRWGQESVKHLESSKARLLETVTDKVSVSALEAALVERKALEWAASSVAHWERAKGQAWALATARDLA